MPDEYKVDYGDVYSRTAELKRRIEVKIHVLPQFYKKNIYMSLEQLDSATNALLQVAMIRNQEKSLVTLEILNKLLLFIENSAKQIELYEQMLASLFSS